jgi:hypothetical protein
MSPELVCLAEPVFLLIVALAAASGSFIGFIVGASHARERAP